MRPRTIEWAAQARRDLFDVVDFLRSERPPAARRFLDLLDRRLAQVARFPESGRPIPEEQGPRGIDERPHREVMVLGWRVGYVVAERITVLYLLHGARRFPPLR